MPSSLDPDRLGKAMDGAGVTTHMLADGVGISLQYACDLVSGRRRLKRNPVLRKKIAAFLNVPVDWIEAPIVRREAS